MQQIITIRRPEPFIHLSRANIMELMEGHIEMIRSKSNDDLRRVAFTVGVDATVVVKNVQVAGAHRVVVGLAAPNHFLPIDINMKSEEWKKYRKGCAEGKEGELAAEIKVCVLSFQNTPKGMCPYLAIAGNPQTLNEANDFGNTVV